MFPLIVIRKPKLEFVIEAYKYAIEYGSSLDKRITFKK